MLTSTPTRFFLATCLGLSSMHAWSQADTLEMDVTFVGSRQMEVRDAVKLSSWPTARPLSNEKPTLNYELLSKRLQFVPSMTPVEATRLRVTPPLAALPWIRTRRGRNTWDHHGRRQLHGFEVAGRKLGPPCTTPPPTAPLLFDGANQRQQR